MENTASEKNSEFIEWLHKQYDAGLNIEQIKQNLPNTKWSEKDLEVALGHYEKDYPKPKSLWKPWKMETEQEAVSHIKWNSIILALLWGADILIVLIQLVPEPVTGYIYTRIAFLILVFLTYQFKSRTASGILFIFSTILLTLGLLDGSYNDSFGASFFLIVTMICLLSFQATLKFHKLRKSVVS